MNAVDRGRLSKSIALIPLVSADETIRSFYKNDWVMFRNVKRRNDDHENESISIEISQDIDQLISVLKGSTVADTNEYSNLEAVWQRLFWLKEWKFVNELQAQEINALLSMRGGWPVIPGHHSWAPLLWVPDSEKAAGILFKKWLFSQKLPAFRVATDSEENISAGRYSWRMGADDSFFVNVSASLKRTNWSKRDFVRALLVVKDWWEEEWVLIKENMERLDELVDMTAGRLSNLDVVVAKFIDAHGYSSFFKSEIFSWMSTVREESKIVGADFLRTKISERFSAPECGLFYEVEQELIASLLCDDLSKANKAISVSWYWVKHPKSSKNSPPTALIATLVAIISTRRMPVLLRVTDLMAQMVGHQNWLSDSSFCMLGNGLSMMFEELTYENRPDGTGIPDEVVPELRLGCIRLAKSLQETDNHQVSAAVSLWVNQIYSDPLPELRYFEE